MLSTTIKHSVATLAVAAGLLAAAGPASAQILEGPILAKADRGEVIGLEPTLKAPTQTWTAGDWIPHPDTQASLGRENSIEMAISGLLLGRVYGPAIRRSNPAGA